MTQVYVSRGSTYCSIQYQYILLTVNACTVRKPCGKGVDVTRLIFLINLLVLMTPVNSEIYKWVDEHGKTQFGDKKPPAKPVEEVSLKINTFTGISDDDVTSGNMPQVVIYTTPSCRYCLKAKQYFRRQHIAYTEYDISTDVNARKRFQEMGGRGVPVILVGERRMNGFSVAGFKSLFP